MKELSSLCLAALLFAPFGAFNCLGATVTETFDSYPDGKALTAVGGSGVWTIGQNTVITNGGVNGSAGLSTGGPIFNWKAQPFQWGTLINGAKVAMSLDFQSSATGTFDDDRVGWTVDADSSTSTANQFALQLDTPEGGMTVYWNSTRTVLNALAGIKNSTWYRFNVEFTKLGVTNASIVGTLIELDASGNPTGTPYVGTVADTATFTNPPASARFTSAFQWPSFKNYSAVDGNADNATFTYTPPYRSYTGTPITENFDGLGTTGTNITLLTGWDAGHFSPAIQQGTAGGSGAATVTDALAVDNGSHDTAGTPMLANFGTTGASDRALGSFARTAPAGDQFLQLAIKNDSGSPITSFVLTYTGEQWRSSSTPVQPLTVWYSNTDPTNGFVSMGSAFTFNSPNVSGTGQIDGNAAGNRTVISATYRPAAPIAAGSTFYIRWYDINENGVSDDFLAIDDLTVTPASGPLPPIVSISSPTDNATVGPSFTITATATDDGTVTNVCFYDGGTLLGNDDTGPAYSYTWNPAPLGSHALTAVAWDNEGLVKTSTVVSVTVSASVNVAPNTPVMIAPTNGATGVATNATLTVSVSDPNGDPMSVVYYGRTLATAPPGPDFTVVVLPDTQFYSESYPAISQAQTDWIVNNRAARNIVYVTGEGDVVNVATDAQYQNATNAYFRLENPATTGLAQGIPYGVPVGNHDTSPYTLFNTYFGTSHWTGRGYYGGSYSTGYQNHYDLFSAGGLDFIVLALEYNAGANSAIMTWANGILQTNANRRAIVVTHSLLQAGYNWPTSAAWSVDGGTTIFPALTNNPNLFLMLCGHNHGQGRRHEAVGSRFIDVLLADYQSDANGGNGYLRTLEFSPSNNVVRVKTYSPSTGGSKTDGDNQFTLDYNMAMLPPFTSLGTNTAVASGTQTSMVWGNLNHGTMYQWYATASDGSLFAVGATNQMVVRIAETPSVLGIVNNGDGSVTVTFAGTPGAEYRVQANTDLASHGSWVNVSTNSAGPNGQWTYTISSMTSYPQRFFRAAKP